MTGALPTIDRAGDDEADPRFLHALLCHLGLPRSAVAERSFMRATGNASILIEAGQRWTGVRFEPQPLPYGSRPRLALVHICSEAVRTRRREIDIGRSTRDFMERLHIRTGGTDMRLFRRQMMALSAARMTFGFGGPERPSTGDLKPIKRFDAWLIDEGGQQVAWPGELVLDADFLETLLEHAVPLDAGAVVTLMNSALAMDVYFWLAHRLCRVRTDQGTRLSWANLHQQFGTEYRDVKEFRRRFLEGLRRAVATGHASHAIGRSHGGRGPRLARARQRGHDLRVPAREPWAIVRARARRRHISLRRTAAPKTAAPDASSLFERGDPPKQLRCTTYPEFFRRPATRARRLPRLRAVVSASTGCREPSVPARVPGPKGEPPMPSVTSNCGFCPSPKT